MDLGTVVIGIVLCFLSLMVGISIGKSQGDSKQIEQLTKENNSLRKEREAFIRENDKLYEENQRLKEKNTPVGKLYD